MTVETLASALGSMNPEGKTLRQGVVTHVTYSAGVLTADVCWGANAQATPTQYFLESYLPIVGDTVWGVREGTFNIIVGKVGGYQIVGGAETVHSLAHCIVSQLSGGAGKGKWADGAGAGIDNINVATTETDLKIGVTSVPVLPSRLLRVKARVELVDRVGGKYMSTLLKTAFNGGSLSTTLRNVIYNGGTGVTESSPVECEFKVVTPSNATSFACKLYAVFDSGNGYFYRYSTGNYADQSWMEVDDIGSAKDYLDQGGTV